MRTIKGFRVLDLPLNATQTAFHHLYVREHNDKSSPSQGRILFVGNVDCSVDLSHEEIDAYLRILLARFGAIESVSVSAFSSDQTDKTRFAHVVFAKKSSIKLAMQATDNDYTHALREVATHFHFLQQAQQKSVAEIREMFGFFDVDPKELQEEVDEFMRDFDESEQREIDERNAMINVPDSDGFVTIVSKSKRKRDSDDAPKTVTDKPKNRKRRKKSTELKNFYRFQIRDDKMKQLDVLRKKFEEDKERVTKMKEARKFNPF